MDEEQALLDQGRNRYAQMIEAMAQLEKYKAAEQTLHDVIKDVNQLRSNGLQQSAAAHQQQTDQTQSQISQLSDLQAFEKQLAEERQARLDAEQSAFETLGLNYEQLTNQLTASSKASTDAMATLAESGQYSSAVIQQALNKAISEATTAEDLSYLREKIQALGDDGRLAGDQMSDALAAVSKKTKSLADATDHVGDATNDAAAEADVLAKSMQDAGMAGQGSMTELINEIRSLVQEVGKLADGFKTAGDQAETMARKAAKATQGVADTTGGATGTTVDSSADTATESGSKRSQSWVSKMAAKLRSQGRDDAAEILSEMIASGDTPTTPKGGGLDAAERWRTAVVNEALERADEVQRQYDQLAEYQRDIAAGDVAAAKELLARRNQFAELEADLVGIVTQAANLVNSSNQSSQTTLSQPGQQVQAPSANEVTVKFDFGDRQIPVRTDSSNANALLSELAAVARVSR